MPAAYELARERYAALGVDPETALATLARTRISLHCWQGDDVGGFEKTRRALGGGLAVTGNYPGKARTPRELRMDLDRALSLIPGKHRVNLHASYGEFGRKRVDRDQINIGHFANWMEWADKRRLGLDFNPTCFSHPKADGGFTLSHRDKGIRNFWIEHCIASRHIASAIGKALHTPTVCNIWIPDGSKDTPVDRHAPRERLAASLDRIFKPRLRAVYDALEPKLFGLGSESYVVGSHEFYLGYAITRQKLLCLDAGHFHPTENVADKLSSVLQFVPAILLHLSRGVRWDSDHVVLLDDPTRAICEEIVRGGFLPRIHLGLDYFDASINRVAAWVIGARNTLKALLLALLEPSATLREYETIGDFTARLALLEELKSMPFAAVWDEHCQRQNTPIGPAWLDDVKRYERNVLRLRK